MTLCIAIPCQDNGPCVVCCSDRMVGNDTESLEGPIKFWEIRPDIGAMYAGVYMPCLDVIKYYRKTIGDEPLKIEDFREVLGAPLESYRDIKTSRPFSEMPEVELLLVAFVEGDFRILKIDSGHGVDEQSFSATIGVAADTADAILKWRKPSRNMSLNQALYYAFEAKKIGEISPFVGKDTVLSVLRGNRESGDFSQEVVSYFGMKAMESAFERMGPRPFDWEFILPPKSFTRIGGT